MLGARPLPCADALLMAAVVHQQSLNLSWRKLRCRDINRNLQTRLLCRQAGAHSTGSPGFTCSERSAVASQIPFEETGGNLSMANCGIFGAFHTGMAYLSARVQSSSGLSGLLHYAATGNRFSRGRQQFPGQVPPRRRPVLDREPYPACQGNKEPELGAEQTHRQRLISIPSPPGAV